MSRCEDAARPKTHVSYLGCGQSAALAGELSHRQIALQLATSPPYRRLGVQFTRSVNSRRAQWLCECASISRSPAVCIPSLLVESTLPRLGRQSSLQSLARRSQIGSFKRSRRTGSGQGSSLRQEEASEILNTGVDILEVLSGLLLLRINETAKGLDRARR